jgi:hypothetical protein
VVVVVRYLWQVSRVGSRVKIAVASCSIQGEALYAERDLMVVMIITYTDQKVIARTQLRNPPSDLK